MNYWLINVSGSNGYSFLVKCNAEDDYEAIKMAERANLFEDEEDAMYAVAEEATKRDIEHFKANGLINEI